MTGNAPTREPVASHVGVRMSDLTTFRLGGPCRRLIDCADAPALLAALGRLRDDETPHFVMGGGSNLLASDEGLDVVVVRFAGAPPAFVPRGGGVLEVPAATALDDLALYAAREGLDGLRFASGIPGTVGGAVAGNAGAYGEQIADRIEALTVLRRDGTTEETGPAAFAFAYRRSSIIEHGTVVLSVRLRLTPGRPELLMAERERILAERKARHPDWRVLPSAGSFFKNIEPTSAAGRRQAAGWFLEQAGAKTFREGGAAVYEGHANIIVNAEPACTAADVHRLSQRMAAAVRAKFGLVLEPEVRRIGRFPPD